MGATRLQLEIYAHTQYFRAKYKLKNFTNEYLFFDCVSRYLYRTVAILKTSVKCYRVIYYQSYLSVDNKCEYRSFRSIADMCVYLDTIAKA